MSEKMTDQMSFTPRVLVVDDEKRIRDGCHKALTQEGFQVSRAESGELGLEILEREHFDIILLDLMMPGVSGMEVLERVTAIHPDSVVIVITGYATLDHTIDAMKKGAFDFVPKPFSPQDLRVVVAKAIEHIRTLKDIASEKSRVRVLVNNLADGVLATDARMNAALANPSFLKMIGHGGENVIGRPVQEFVKNPELRQMIEEALSMPTEEFTELTQEFSQGSLAKDKETVLTARCVPFRDRLGRNLGSITVLHDITALKKMDQIKSDFVSMVAHEIQSPMNSVLMQIKLIQKGLAGDTTEKQREILDRVTDRVKSLSTLASDLLDLAKIESGLITQEKERLNLAEVILEQVSFHQPKATAKKLRLNADALQDALPVLGNRYNMDEIISNLIGNAIKYTPEGGEITISGEVQSPYVCIQVADTGFGIDPDELEHIFERFYRVKNEQTRYISGTGLGLAIVKSIVEAHNGTIKVTSRPNQGTTFTVYLPTITS